jgi:sec-independent protein translocase protein TatA
MFGLGPGELLVVGVVAVLLFGSNLPSVARSLGKSMSEFKKGMHDLQDELRNADSRPAQVRRYHEIDDRDEATAPKFEPPASEPTLEEPRQPEQSETRETVPPNAEDKPFTS